MSSSKILYGFSAILFMALVSFAPHPAAYIKTIPDKNAGFNEGIEFNVTSWEQAKQEAREQHKLIFLDAYASWCGPCKMLRETTFNDPVVGEYFNAHFICISVDMEKGEGPALARQFPLTAYPTLFITNENGKLITQTVGFKFPRQLIHFGKKGVRKAK